MADKLTEKQRLAVENRGGKLLVSAAAGSGKTKVLVDRLLRYITNRADPANVDDFLIVTFTKAAAAELRGKIAAALSERISEEPDNAHLHEQMRRLYMAKISTVHGFCGDILKENAYRLDIPGDFRIAENAETDELKIEAVWSTLENAYENAYADRDIQCFLEANSFTKRDDQLAEIIQKVYDAASCHLNPTQWLDTCVGWSGVDGVSDISQTVWGEYLVEDFHSNLKMHLEALNRCLNMICVHPALNKAAGVIGAEIAAYEKLLASNTWEDTVRDIKIQFSSLTFPTKFEDKGLIESVKAIRNDAKNYVVNAAKLIFASASSKLIDELRGNQAVTKGLVKLVKMYIEAYGKLKMAHHVLDFNDLEHKTHDLFWGKSHSGVTALAREIGMRFREVMVDEYQDTNAVQDAIFKALTDQRKNCFMVGDVKQSIYQFRLAEPGIFLDRYNRYAPSEKASEGQGRRVILSDNFRSSAAVIDGVNDVFSACMCKEVGGLAYTDEEMLREGGSTKPDIGEPSVEFHAIEASADAPLEEAAFVVGRIKQLIDGTHMIRDKDSLRPIRPDDITILLRSAKLFAAFYQHELIRAGIPCATDGDGDLLLTEEVSEIHAILQAISNPRQDIPLAAALVGRTFCFTANDLAEIRLECPRRYLYDSIQASKNEKAMNFISVLDDLRERSRMGDVADVLNNLLRVTGLDSIYGSLSNGQQRSANIRKLLEYAYAYCANGHKTLDQFLSHLASVDSIKTEQSGSAAGGVSICTIHASKGLEYPVVFLSNLSYGIKFDDNKLRVVSHKELGIGFNCTDTDLRVYYPSIAKRAILKRCAEDTLSEEMRILYVAMTRAKDRLIMTYCAKRLDNDISSIVTRLPMSSKQLMSRNAKCLGDWILCTALQKTEAGELFAIGGNPQMGKLSAHPWVIKVVDGSEIISAASENNETKLDETADLSAMAAALSFAYPFTSATKIPSKLTATQIKGRMIDKEISENAPPKHTKSRSWRAPLEKKEDASGTAYGTAIHTIMEHLDFDRCATVADITNQINEMSNTGLISREIAQKADADSIFSFFQTDIGRRICTGGKVYREFKFSILTDADAYYPAPKGEKVLLQGVVDIAVIVDNKIYLADFKTDFVTEETLPTLTAEYAHQVNAYKKALERVFGLPVASAQLYFFRLKKLVDIQ